MSTPDPPSARADSNPRGWSAMPAAAGPQAAEPEYVFWHHTGEGSVFFFSAGLGRGASGHRAWHRLAEVRRKRRGHHDHAHQHCHKPFGRPDTIGDLIAVGNAHQAAA
jgi:hypothetical protein